ncbi:MAG TPA: type II secretion system secretin GspD [Rhodanobacteraceae bacterium]|nr:type II secretion system secretin GspD [Rhodanobacteraceae bacterium]
MPSRFIVPLTACALALLAGCASSPEKQGAGAKSSDILTADTILKPAAPIESSSPETGIAISPQALSDQEPPKPEIQIGTARFTSPQPPLKTGASGEADVVFNFENQPIQAVIKAVLGDLLQENYTIAPNVGGNVTFSTSKPIRRSEALPVLEMLLAANGVSIVRQGDRYTVMPTKEAIVGRLTPSTAPIASAKGYELRIFPLQYVSPSEMAKLLKPYARPEAIVSIDTNRSLLVMAGTAAELANYQQTIETFDVDWLKGMSVGVFTLQHVEVGKLLPDLLKIFGSDGESPLAGMFRFMPIEQTNSLVVITPQPEYLKSAEEWLYRLDRGGAENATQLYVYDVKNMKAPDLGDYLSQIFLGTSTGASHSSTTGSVAPGLRSTTLGSRGGTGSAMSYQNSLRPQSEREKSTPAATKTTPAAGGGQGSKETDIRISAVEENNQLMIQATPAEWSRIEAAIKKLDVVPLQVQIEARILEVSLDGDLSFGVQWYLAGLIGTASGSAQENGRYPYAFPPGSGPSYTGNSHDRHRFSLGATGSTKPTSTGGLFYSFLNRNFEVAINALEQDGQAKSLAAPSLVVANNQEAQINVGQQIPVVQNYVTGIGLGTANGQAYTPGYGSVQYLNTGVTLDVKPRVNPGGLVYLDIQQEVSNPGNAGANGNPPINQRLIQTQVAVQSGETLLLGGLIQDTTNDNQTGLPLVSKVPILRNLFGSTHNVKHRTELIVLITPRVIRNSDEGRQMTLDYTRQFQSLVPLRQAAQSSTPPPPPPEQPAPAHEPATTQEDPTHEH